MRPHQRAGLPHCRWPSDGESEPLGSHKPQTTVPRPADTAAESSEWEEKARCEARSFTKVTGLQDTSKLLRNFSDLNPVFLPL